MTVTPPNEGVNDDLSAEALTAHVSTLQERIASATSPDVTKVAGERKPTRGRPPKSTSGRITPPPRPPKPTQPQIPPEEQARLKKLRAEEIGGKIATEINDNLMTLLMAAGLPVNMLYKKGMEPKSAPKDSPYTDLGEMFALGPMQTQSIGRFIAEFEGTEMGKKTSGAVGANSNIPLVLYGLLSIGAMGQYVQNLSKAVPRIKQMMDAQKRYEQQLAEQQERQQKAPNNGQQPPPPGRPTQTEAG